MESMESYSSWEIVIKITHLWILRFTLVSQEERGSRRVSFCIWFGATDGAPERCLACAAAGGCEDLEQKENVQMLINHVSIS